jgi:hypothetical protein
MVHRIKYIPIVNIVDYFKEIRTLSRPIEYASLATYIALNIGCPEMHNVAYIEGGCAYPWSFPFCACTHFA